MKVQLICVGDELLNGRVRDLNAHWLGGWLSRCGHKLSAVDIVADGLSHVVEALARAQPLADLVIVSGGLGPTEDDRVRRAASQFFAQPLVRDPASLEAIAARFARAGRPFHATNEQQADFPEGATVFPNQRGTAPGFSMTVDTTEFLFFPGVPREFQWFVECYVGARLSRPEITRWSRTWRFFGLGESDVAHRVEDIDETEISVHYLARMPEIHMYALTEGEGAEARGEAYATQLINRVGPFLVAVDDETLIDRLGRRLVERGATLASAESCTGGLIAQLLTAISGSSGYFNEAVVTYSDEAKVARLGVSEDTLLEHGAVSRAVSIEMALGMRRLSGADYTVAVTGIAGPTGGTADKPIGTVHIGLATPEGTWHRALSIGPRPRDDIRMITAWAALSSVLFVLEERVPDQLLRLV